MKKLRFLFLTSLIFYLVFISCNNNTNCDCSSCNCSTDEDDSPFVENTDGQLTISGLDTYNGEWVMAFGDLDSSTDSLAAAVSIDLISDTGKCAKISNGSAVLKVWKIDENDLDPPLKNYTGNDYSIFNVFIISEETFILTLDHLPYLELGFAEVTFTNGIGSGVFIPD